MKDEAGKIVSPDNFINAADVRPHPGRSTVVIENALRWLVSEADERERLALCSINPLGPEPRRRQVPAVRTSISSTAAASTPARSASRSRKRPPSRSFRQANRFIQALKDLGCKFALDDFGNGTVVVRLPEALPRGFPQDRRQLRQEILHDPIDREMVRSINEIGHLTGKLTIAEFAENRRDHQHAAEPGVDYAQGYGIGSPQRIMKIAANA